MHNTIISQLEGLKILGMKIKNPLDNYAIRNNAIQTIIKEQTIGEGTFGKVKGAVHKPTNQPVAIKVLEKSRITNSADFLRIQREIHILRTVRHPNLIQLYEILESETKIYLIMEYVEEGELFNYIVRHQSLPQSEAARIFQQIINALEYMHSINVVHRDLKPENLLLDYNLDIKVVDFGLSSTYKNGQLLKTPCGSPCYAAPEMVAGQQYYGLKTDIWSSGIVLYAMLCGCVPFTDKNTKKLYEKIKKHDFEKPSHLSSEAIDLLEQLLCKDANKRIDIKRIREHAFIQQHKQDKVNILSINSLVNPFQNINTLNFPINEDILLSLQQFGIDYNQTKNYLQNNKHNQVTTTYYILLKFINKQIIQQKQLTKQDTPKYVNKVKNKTDPQQQQNKSESAERQKSHSPVYQRPDPKTVKQQQTPKPESVGRQKSNSPNFRTFRKQIQKQRNQSTDTKTIAYSSTKYSKYESMDQSYSKKMKQYNGQRVQTSPRQSSLYQQRITKNAQHSPTYQKQKQKRKQNSLVI